MKPIRNPKRKGQIWSLDFAVSVVIFISMITTFLFAFNNLSLDASKQNELLVMQNLALEVTEALVRTEGQPVDWNSTRVRIIGLAREENILNETKVLQLVGLDYNRTKGLMGIMYYDYNFSMSYLNGTLVNMNSTDIIKGPNCINPTDTLYVDRYVILNNHVTRLRYVLCRG